MGLRFCRLSHPSSFLLHPSSFIRLIRAQFENGARQRAVAVDFLRDRSDVQRTLEGGLREQGATGGEIRLWRIGGPDIPRGVCVPAEPDSVSPDKKNDHRNSRHNMQ